MASKQNTIAARLSDDLYARFNDCIAAEVAARVTPATAALYADVAPYHGGVGKAIDGLSGLVNRREV